MRRATTFVILATFLCLVGTVAFPPARREWRLSPPKPASEFRFSAGVPTLATPATGVEWVPIHRVLRPRPLSGASFTDASGGAHQILEAYAIAPVHLAIESTVILAAGGLLAIALSVRRRRALGAAE